MHQIVSRVESRLLPSKPCRTRECDFDAMSRADRAGTRLARSYGKRRAEASDQGVEGMTRSSVFLAGNLLMVFLAAGACSYKSPTAPAMTSSQPGPAGATISITPSGLSPASVGVTAGQSVTFTNNDTVPHQIVSTPVPTYSDCPAINNLGTLQPGQSMQTGALTSMRSCGFLDLLNTNDGRFQGMITIQ
jgi:plastocyanin